MSKRLFVIALVLSLSCISYADVLLGDFEDGSLDNWGPAWGDAEVTVATSDFGATSGSSSLAATVASGGYWRLQWAGEQDMTNKTAVSIDVTFNPDEWVAEEGAWAQLDAIAIQPDWFQVGPSSIINRDTGEEVGKAWGGAEEDSRRTYTWDITGKEWVGVTAVEIFLSVQWASYSQGGAFYIDNIQLVGPEAGPSLGNVILVTEQVDLDGDGIRDDQGLEDFLKVENYTVDVQPGYWAELDPDKIAALEAADLVVFSRSANSGNYDDGDEPTQWNSISTPLVQLSAYLVRSSRWKWVDSTAATNNSGSPLMEVLAPGHPVFVGVALDSNNQVDAVDETVGAGQTSFISTLDMGNGVLLAKAVADTDLAWIAEWQAGVEFYDGAEQVTGGPRMMFMACTQEVGATSQGGFNLTAEGQLMLSNALKYMLPPKSIEVENASFELPGTEKIKGWNGEGVGGTPAEDIPGWSSDSEVADSGVETGWGATDGEWTAFLMGGDPSVWQLTSYVIGADDVIEMKVDSKNNWQATTVQLVLYYDDNGVRIPAAIADGELTDEMQEFSVVLNAADAPDAVGALLGIEINNVTEASDSWLAIDNIRLTVK